MEVTRQLLTERAGKKGLVRIQLTFCWAGLRLRLSSGQKIAPKDWDSRRERVKAKPGTYADEINQVLDTYTDAATAVHHEATLRLEHPDKATMRTAIEARYRQLLAAAAGLAEVPAPPVARPRTVAEEMLHWVDTVVARRISRRTGKPIKKKVVQNHRRAALDLASFAAQRPEPLTYAGIDARFHADFMRYLLVDLKRGPGTFNHYLGLLIAFLKWADYEGHPINRRFREVLLPVEHQTEVISLTEAQVLAIAGLDLDTPAVRAYVQEHFPERPTAGVARLVTTEERLRRLRLTRDLFLLCTYTALRVGDAIGLTPAQLHGDVARVKASKTGAVCIIPLLDDHVFRPAALLRQYAGTAETCLPHLVDPYDYIAHVQHLAGVQLPRRLGFHMGRKTFATLKVAQGIPRTQVMMATGHKTEASFNLYLGVDELELLAWYRRTARNL